MSLSRSQSPSHSIRIFDLNSIARVVFPATAKEKQIAVITAIPTLDSFLDESSDENRQDVFAVGALVTAEPNWRLLQEKWVKRLDQDGVKYFRATSCKAVHGPFLHLRKKCGSLDAAKKLATKIRIDLEEILLSSDRWGGFGLCVNAPDYDWVLKEIEIAKIFYPPDYTIASYQQMMFEIARAIRRKEKGEMGALIVIDESSDYPKIAHAFKAIKKNHSVIGRTLVSIAPGDDKVTPPLQMADLLASIVKDAFLEWNNGDCKGNFPLAPKWLPHFIQEVGIWDKGHMLRSLRKTVESPRFIRGELARYPERKPTKSDIKRMRKELIKKATMKPASL